MSATQAGAQFTTVVAPQAKKTQQKAAVTAAQRKARTDSLQRASIAGMKAWVDSAALALSAGGADSARSTSIAVAPDTTRRDSTGAVVRDSLRAPKRSSAAGEVLTPRRDSSTDSVARARRGRRPPDTATPLPTIALVGGALVLGGLAMRRRRA